MILDFRIYINIKILIFATSYSIDFLSPMRIYPTLMIGVAQLVGASSLMLKGIGFDPG